MTQPALIAPGRRVTPGAYRVLPADASERDWLAARRRGIGSSDVAAIMGVAEHRTALHVWFDKRDRLPDDDAGEAALWGKLHEDTVAREWARRNRSTVRRVGLVAALDGPFGAGGQLVMPSRSWMLCTLDRQVGVCPATKERATATVCSLEVKTRNAFVSKRWRRNVPDDVLAQVVWQMAVTGYDHTHVACLIGGNDYRQYVVRRDLALEADIVATVADFWARCVLGGERPEVDVEAYADDLVDLDNRVHPVRAGSARLDGVTVGNLIRDYERARLAETGAKRAKSAAKAEMVRLLDGTEAAVVDQGRVDPVWTYFEQNRRPDVNLARLAELWPDAYADCVADKTGRTLAIARDLRLTEGDL